MSKLIVEITSVKDIQPHPNADRLEIATVKGWSVIVQKDLLSPGDLVVFIPPDAILPALLHEYLNITKYCAELPKSFNTNARRVKAARLRGEVSYGTIMTMKSFLEYTSNNGNTKIDSADVIDALGITKWEPPVKSTQGDVMKDNPQFPKYTSIEHWGNYPDVWLEDEEVVITEKIHGCFREDSLVTMSDGTQKPIKDIVVGEKVKTYDVDKGLFTHSDVEGVLVQDETDQLDWFELEFDNGQTLVCTEDHPVLTTDGWIKARDLTENHIVLGESSV